MQGSLTLPDTAGMGAIDHGVELCPSCEAAGEYTGEEAKAFAAARLVTFDYRPSSDGALSYYCAECGASWALDFPNAQRGPFLPNTPRLRRLPIPPGSPPMGASFWA
jgi:hypothetical protein